ncbi:MAG: hypothetical protein ABIT37_02905 [Luteolibacter sp.]
MKLAAECGIEGNIRVQFEKVSSYFERLIDAAETLDDIEAISVGLKAAEAGRSQPVPEVIREWEAL